MKSVMDTESSLSKDVKRFLTASQSWEPTLTLSASCQQASYSVYFSLVVIGLLYMAYPNGSGKTVYLC